MTSDPEMLKALEAATPLPRGWEPYAEESGQIGSAIVRLPRPNATERDLLIGAGFDPDCWRIKGSVNTRRWMRYDQEWLYYYKFDVAAGESPEVREAHVDEIVKRLRRRKRQVSKIRGGTDAIAFHAADWQIGKAEGKVGSAETAERVADVIDQASEEIKNLRRLGFALPVGAFIGTGDIGEGTCGFYPNQEFLIDLNRRDQNKLTRELITYGIDTIGPLFDVFHIKTVGGNHGENRNDGKKVSDDGDNDDVAQFEAVKEAYDRAAKYGAGPSNLVWQIPEDELTIADTLGGVRVAWTHGHLFGTGTTAQVKAHNWWKGQDFGFQAARGAQILVSSHFHHNSEVTYGRRTHLQTGAMDPGSKWFRDRAGEDSPPSALLVRFSDEEPLGFSHKRLLSPHL